MSRNAILGTIVAALGSLLAISQVIMTVPVALAATATSNVRPDTIKAALHIVVSPTVRIRTFVKYYTVRKGDTLSSISRLVFGSAEKWPWLYGANEQMIGVDPDVIQPGQHIQEVLASKPEYGAAVQSVNHARRVSAEARRRIDGKVWGVTYGYPNKCGDGDGDGWDVNCATSSASGHTARLHSAGAVDVHVNTAGRGSFEQCVISRESGGNSQVMNSSGHYGLYQFSESTWEAYGGSAGSFGHASPSEQRRVFLNAMAQGGQSNWSPYDGC
jgi:hypothetical protein